MGHGETREVQIGPKIANPEEEKYVLKYMLRHLRERSPCPNRVRSYVFRAFFDLPMLWAERMLEVFGEFSDESIYLSTLEKELCWFIYGHTQRQISVLFRMFDCNDSRCVEPKEFQQMLSHLPRQLVVKRVVVNDQQGVEGSSDGFKIINAPLNWVADDTILSAHKTHKLIDSITESIVASYSKTRGGRGMGEEEFAHWIYDNPAILLYFMEKFRRRLVPVQQNFTTFGMPSRSEFTSEVTKDEEEILYFMNSERASRCQWASCEGRHRRKYFLEVLLKTNTKSGELVGKRYDSEKAIKYFACMKDDCLYLLSESRSRLIHVIFLKSFFASTTPGILSYPYGFELINEGLETVSCYYFYSNVQKNAADWIECINQCNDLYVMESKYEQREKIGTGKFSIVYRCLGRDCSLAMKAIAKANLSVKEKRLLQNEVNIVPDLYNHNIARCYDIFESKTHIFLLLEHVRGGELFEFLRKKRYFSEFEVCYVTYHLLCGLAYLHKRGIMHRDLKPENILIELDDSGEKIVTVKLIDFGLGKVIKENALVVDACGTPAYVAPEVLTKSGYNCQIDMWSLGVVAFFMTRGKLPFHHKSRKELFDLICNKDPTYDENWKKYSPQCKQFVQSLLVRNFRKRLTAAQALQHPWVQGYYEEIMMTRYNYLKSKADIDKTIPVDESLSSEMRSFERENVPVEEQIFQNFRTVDAKEVTDTGMQKMTEEADLEDI